MSESLPSSNPYTYKDSVEPCASFPLVAPCVSGDSSGRIIAVGLCGCGQRDFPFACRDFELILLQDETDGRCMWRQSSEPLPNVSTTPFGIEEVDRDSAVETGGTRAVGIRDVAFDTCFFELSIQAFLRIAEYRFRLCFPPQHNRQVWVFGSRSDIRTVPEFVGVVITVFSPDEHVSDTSRFPVRIPESASIAPC